MDVRGQPVVGPRGSDVGLRRDWLHAAPILVDGTTLNHELGGGVGEQDGVGGWDGVWGAQAL